MQNSSKIPVTIVNVVELATWKNVDKLQICSEAKEELLSAGISFNGAALTSQATNQT
jgi:hypothetical protein